MGTRKNRREPMTEDIYWAVMNRSQGRCEAVCSPRCTRSATHWHHRQLRSAGGENSPENGAALCLQCHDWVHRNVADARDGGWIVSRWADPAVVPMRIRGRDWLLGADGTLTAVTS